MMAKADLPEYLDGRGFIAEVIRTSRKKTASIRVEEGVVSVVVPTNTTTEKVEKLLTDKRTWIKQKIAIQQELSPASGKSFVSGEAFPYLGRNYRLKVTTGAFAPVKLLQGRLVVQVPEGSQQPHVIRNAIIRWYKRQAEQKLQEKVSRYAPLVGVKPTEVSVRSFKARWGSCTPDGKLEFNWLIMQAPNRMVDYVVIHELCHLIHHDHSPSFWYEVQRVMPDYQTHKDWLKENSKDLRV